MAGQSRLNMIFRNVLMSDYALPVEEVEGHGTSTQGNCSGLFRRVGRPTGGTHPTHNLVDDRAPPSAEPIHKLFGKSKLAWFQSFLDTAFRLWRCFARLDPVQLHASCPGPRPSLSQLLPGEVVARITEGGADYVLAERRELPDFMIFRMFNNPENSLILTILILTVAAGTGFPGTLASWAAASAVQRNAVQLIADESR